MDRKEFFKALGIATGSVTFACLASCKKEYQQIIPPDANFTLDLDSPDNAVLKKNGGYIYKDGVVVARTISGEVVAVAQACTHLGTSVQYQGGGNLFYCPNHSATFKTDGIIIQGPVTMPLKQYTVTVNGNIITVVG